MLAFGGFTCHNLIRAPRAIRMLGIALLLLAVAPSWSEARSHLSLAIGTSGSRSAFAYEVSPPPATRATLPNYLPRLPPENVRPHRSVAADERAPLIRLRNRCFCGHHRPHHAQSCRHCRHGAGSAVARRCRRGGCGYPDRGRSEPRHAQHQLSAPAEAGKRHNVIHQRRGNHRAGRHRRWHHAQSFGEGRSNSAGGFPGHRRQRNRP